MVYFDICTRFKNRFASKRCYMKKEIMCKIQHALGSIPTFLPVLLRIFQKNCQNCNTLGFSHTKKSIALCFLLLLFYSTCLHPFSLVAMIDSPKNKEVFRIRHGEPYKQGSVPDRTWRALKIIGVPDRTRRALETRRGRPR